ncbi:hypothetical protein WMF30_30940 [Sorangium sp. So ce134]
MKKLKRTDRSIDYIKLLAQHSQLQGIAAYSQEAIRQFGDSVCDGLTSSVSAEHRLRGLRAESLFMAVVSGIGKVQLIKEEDSGELYYTGDDVQVPDFRIVTANSSQLLVEVKVHQLGESPRSQYRLSDRCVRSLRRYSELTGCELRIAIFWEELRTWTLNRLESFIPGASCEKKWAIGFPKAFATNEMASLGDVTVATLAPMRFRVELDPDKSEPVPEGKNGKFTVVVSAVSLLSQDRILSGIAAQIAWKLIWYGKWTEGHRESHYENGRLVWVDHLIVPQEWDDNEVSDTQPMIVGALSEMITNAYLAGA